MEKERKIYILGTELAELHRLGVQHQVWASEARMGWTLGDFKAGQVILDLGSGPGFASRDLAYIAGDSGQVIAVDQSSHFLDFLGGIRDLHQLSIELKYTSFDDMELADNSIDRVYCRWALAWIPNPEEILAKIYRALKPSGKIVTHEYFDWDSLQTEPYKEHLNAAMRHAFRSFREGEGMINIGRKLPVMFQVMGMQHIRTRPMTKLVRPTEMAWQWPETFFKIYFPKLSESGFMPEHLADKALAQWAELTKNSASLCLCPQMIEVIGTK